MSDETDQRDQDAIDAARREVKGVDGSSPAGQAETRAPEPSSSPPPDSFAGYKIVREIHRGGQGVVYQAFQESTKRKVAIKVMKEGPFAGSADKARFEREVQILGQLKHPNIVTVYDSGTAAGSFFFVMDYISGQPLDVYMSRQEHSIDETLKLFAKICEAVNSAHLKGVIHRDLKPRNIRIDDEGRPHILDFGLAKVALGSAGVSPAEAPMMTMTGQFIGSLPWSSPEQAEGKPGKIDVRTDVYSLGVILYQMLTGKFPYDVVGNMRDVLDRIMKAEPARPSTIRRKINDEVETIVLKCLSKERERRYQTAGELARDIGHYLAGEPIEAKRDSFGYVLRKQLRRYRVPAATAAAFVVLLIAGTVVSTTMYVRAEEQRRLAQLAGDEAEAVNDFLTKDLLAAVAPSTESGRGKDVLMRDVLDQAASRVGGRFEEMPLVEASIRATLGRTYLRLGEYAAAEPHLERALLLRRRELAEEHPSTLASMNELAILYGDQGRYNEAEALFVKTLEIQKRVLGEEHPDTLNSMNNLAILYKIQGRYDEAEPLHVKTLEMRKRVLGEEHPDTLTSMNNLANLYQKQGRYDEAEPLSVKTLEIEKRVLGEEHSDTLGSMNNLANLYLRQGRYDEAEALYRQTIEIKKRVLGEEHRNTLMSINNLALLYRAQARYDEAEPLYVKTLEIQKRVLGEEHLDTLRTMNNLAELYGDQGRMDDARPLVRALQEVRRRRADRPGASVGDKNELAWDLLTCEPALRDPETALRLARDACAMTDNAKPNYLDTLGLAQFMTGDITAAIETEKKALSLLAPDAPGRGDYEAALARFEAALKEADAADSEPPP